MEKTDLFDFSFVDREYEKCIFDNFISNYGKEILWVNGQRAVGKTQFVKHMVSRKEQYTFVYYEIKNNSNSEDILINFIQELQKLNDDNFLEFFRKEYKSFYNNLGQTTVRITKNFCSKISNVVSIILDISNYVITKGNERREPIDIIKKYIERLLVKYYLFICIDNFSMANENIITLFCDILKTFSDNKKCKSCIITTNNDIDADMKLKIQEMISPVFIEIEQFQNYRYFWEIMDPIFDMSDFTYNDIQYIFLKCKGKPHNLSIIISKLLEKHGITLVNTSQKAIINKSILQEILKEERIHYSERDFKSFQTIIIFSFLCLYDGVDIQTLKELTIFVAKRNFLYAGFTEEKFYEILLELIDYNKLKSDGKVVFVCHDSDYIDYVDIFRKSNLYRIISQNAYEFLIQHETLSAREDLICQHMHVAGIEGWKSRNFIYGKEQFDKHLYFDADKYFSYLLKEPECLDNGQLLIVAINKYQEGYYNGAINILKKIEVEKLDSALQKYKLFFYFGKSIYNSTGNVPKAVYKLEQASNYVAENSAEYVHVKNMLQMLYIELPEKRENALSIFENIRDNYKTSQPDAWASTMRGCHNFIKDNVAALNLLEEAFGCTKDELERAYIGTTMGFVHARSGNLNEAKKCFEKAYKVIKEIKRHDSSYAANNLAICYMIENKYLEAKEILLDALFWNKTNYGKVVLNIHLMLCETFLKNNLEAEKYYNFLVTYINNRNVNDSIMLRKIYLNLAIASKELGLLTQSKVYIDKAKNYVNNTSSEWRYRTFLGIAGESAPQNVYYGYTKFDPWFLVYAHD